MNDSPAAIRFLRLRLRNWFPRHGRSFPWRETRDPYLVLMAEMMLRRTRADQVKPIYEEFVRRFPTPAAALHHTAAVKKLLEPLGLKWRAVTIVTALRQIAQEHKGLVPTDPGVLRTLHGVGEYVSNAVACLSKGLAVPIMDTNVIRVICRFTGIPPRDSLRRQKGMLALASRFLDQRDSRTYNLALLDLAHLVCTSRKPKCISCPLQAKCTFNTDLRT